MTVIVTTYCFKDVNAALYYKNPDPNEFYSMVPISARSGDGMGSLIACLIAKSQTTLAQHLIYSEELQATVMEVSWSRPPTRIEIRILVMNRSKRRLVSAQRSMWCWSTDIYPSGIKSLSLVKKAPSLRKSEDCAYPSPMKNYASP